MVSVFEVPTEDSRCGAAFDVKAGSCSVQGARRTRNEDYYYVDPDLRYFIVADGIGGSRAGHIASHLGCHLLSDCLAVLCHTEQTAPVLASQLGDVVDQVHSLFVEHRSQDWRLTGMGTTVVTAMIVGDVLIVGSLGDSRAYLVRDGRAIQLTLDHTFTQALVDVGLLSADEARTHPLRNVLQKHLGCQELADGTDVETIQLKEGDRLLLASDGVTGNLDDSSLAGIIRGSPDAQHAAEKLIRNAIEYGSSDDATCIVVFID